MIEVVRGTERALLHEGQARAAGTLLWLYAPGREQEAWAAVRALVAQLVEQTGSARVGALLARHAPAAGFAFGSTRAALDARGRAQADDWAAGLRSHLSHNFFLQRPLFEAWGALLSELLATTDRALFVPSPYRLDMPSLAAFKMLVFGPSGVAKLLLGWVDDAPDPSQDEHGIVWGYARAELDALALGVQQLPGASSREAPARGSAGGLAARHEPEQTTDLAALRQAFGAFAFTAALRLGLALEAGGLVTDAADQAELHAIIALSAHNRQFSAAGNRRLAAFIERHLLAALRHEARPAERSALCYRLGSRVGGAWATSMPGWPASSRR